MDFTKHKKVLACCSGCGRLPWELEREILLRLPIEDCFRCKCVCKRWRDEINSNDFMSSHKPNNNNNTINTSFIVLNFGRPFRLYPIEIELPSSTSTTKVKKPIFCDHIIPGSTADSSRLTIIGSSNGLLCFNYLLEYIACPLSEEYYFIYNPATRASKSVPRLKQNSVLHDMGFGYDFISHDYKLLLILEHFETRIYSLKANSWKVINEPTFPDEDGITIDTYYSKCRSPMALSNNALHNIYYFCAPAGFWSCNKVILAFDLASYKYHNVPLPPLDQCECDPRWNWSLVDLRGCLHIGTGTEIWIMKEYGSKESWSKVIRLAEPILPAPHHLGLKESQCRIIRSVQRRHLGNYAYSMDGREIIILVMSPDTLFLRHYNLHNQMCTRHENISGNLIDDSDHSGAFPWVASFVSPL